MAASSTTEKGSPAAAAANLDRSSISGNSSRRTSTDPASATAAENKTNTTTTLEKQPTYAQQPQDDTTITRTPTRDDGTPYPTGTKLQLIVLALGLAVFLMGLDNSIITTAIPRISDDFNSLDDVGWYASSYLLTQASFQLLFGRFYTLLGTKRTFLAAISLFELGSLVCGVSPNSIALIIGRAIAGVGAAGIFSGALMILAHSMPLEKRPLYGGMIGGMYGVSSIAGPLLGGAFTDHVTWRWCFYINLPVGAVTLLVITFFYEDSAAATDADASSKTGKTTFWAKTLRFDPFGNLIFMPAVICLLLALQWGGTTYPWSSPRIIALFVLSGVLLTAFMVLQIYLSTSSSSTAPSSPGSTTKTPSSATLPLHILTNRTVWASSVFAFCLGASSFVLIYYLPIYFQAVQSVGPLESGIRNLPLLLSNIVASLVGGVIVTTFGYFAPLMLAATVVMAIGAGLLTLLYPDAPTGLWIGAQIVMGFGVGMGFQQPMIAVQAVLPIEDVAAGTALVVFLQSLGGALFIAVGQTVFTNKLTSELAAKLPTIDPTLILSSGATNLKNVLDPSQLGTAIAAYSTALTTTFYVSVGMAVATLAGSATVEWKSVKGKQIDMGAA